MISANGAQVISAGTGGRITPFNNISTTPQQVLAGNPQRSSITFHNPGSVDIIVAPVLQANGQPLTVSTALLGGGFRVFANGGDRILTGECQGAYQAFSVSGSGNPLTVSESNV